MINTTIRHEPDLSKPDVFIYFKTIYVNISSHLAIAFSNAFYGFYGKFASYITYYQKLNSC